MKILALIFFPAIAIALPTGDTDSSDLLSSPPSDYTDGSSSLSLDFSGLVDSSGDTGSLMLISVLLGGVPYGWGSLHEVFY